MVTLFTLGNSSDLFLLLYAQTKFRMSLLGVIGMWVVLHCSKITFSLAGGHWADVRGRRPAIVTGWLMDAVVYLGFASAGLAGLAAGLLLVLPSGRNALPRVGSTRMLLR